MRPGPSDPLTPRRRLLVRGGILAVAGVIAAGGLWVVAAVPPAGSPYFPKCHFHELTGLHCPGCGTTRALHAALNGDLARAAAYNPLAFVFLPAIGVAIARAVWAWLWDAPPRPAGEPRRWVRWVPWVAFAVILGFAVLRNVPAYPFTLLAPHELP